MIMILRLGPVLVTGPGGRALASAAAGRARARRPGAVPQLPGPGADTTMMLLAGAGQ